MTMRFAAVVKNDMRYQIKYGFYFLYAFISAIYIAILLIMPEQYKGTAASLIVLTDPAMLGIFFIGGIWLLEKREGLHGFLLISPLRPSEYVLSKAVSLSVISTLSAVLIILIAFRGMCNFLMLAVSVFLGSMVFTVIGLLVATYARSVNQYLIITILPAVILAAPAVLSAFGISHPAFDILPGTALWRIIAYALNIEAPPSPTLWLVLIAWLAAVLFLAHKRVPAAMLHEGGEKG